MSQSRNPPRNAPSGFQRRPGRVLVVDDEPFVAKSIQMFLSDEHQLTVAASAAEALALLGEGATYDVILCDLMMPEQTGMGFYEHLQAHAPQWLERIIFITGGACTAEARDFLARAEIVWLDKPLDPFALRALVRQRVAEIQPQSVSIGA